MPNVHPAIVAYRALICERVSKDLAPPIFIILLASYRQFGTHPWFKFLSL